jgi:hypothetical protein
MGEREGALRELIINAGFAVIDSNFNFDENRRKTTRATNVINCLDGAWKLLSDSAPPTNASKQIWDILLDLNAPKSGSILFKGRQYLAIELDEEQHFNRYRAATLASTIYCYLPHFPFDAYSRMCVAREPGCIQKASHGNYWTSPPSAKYFGRAARPGSLRPPGSPRWKQRAYEDLRKDALPLLVSNLSVVRLSVWDTLRAGSLLGQILTEPGLPGCYTQDILSLIRSRMTP